MNFALLRRLSAAAMLGFGLVTSSPAHEPGCIEFMKAYPYRTALDTIRALPEFRDWQRSSGERAVFGDEPQYMPRIGVDCAWLVEVFADREDRLMRWQSFLVTVPTYEVLVIDPVTDERIPIATWRANRAVDPLHHAVAQFLRERKSLPGDYRALVGRSDLDGDGALEAIVLLQDAAFCGTGGCTLLVLAQRGSTWRRISATTQVEAPIVVSTEPDHGWRRIGVVSPKVGRVELRFDGQRYPNNASVAPTAGASKVASELKLETIVFGLH